MIFHLSTECWNIEDPLFWFILSELLTIERLKLKSPSLKHNAKQTVKIHLVVQKTHQHFLSNVSGLLFIYINETYKFGLQLNSHPKVARSSTYLLCLLSIKPFYILQQLSETFPSVFHELFTKVLLLTYPCLTSLSVALPSCCRMPSEYLEKSGFASILQEHLK